jgi:hypothetical protein
MNPARIVGMINRGWEAVWAVYSVDILPEGKNNKNIYNSFIQPM